MSQPLDDFKDPHFLNKAFLCEHYSCAWRPHCRVSVVWSSRGVFGLAEDNIHWHRASWLPNCASSSETIADCSSGQQLGISTFFSIAPHPPLPPSYLVFLHSVLFHPSISHPSTHSSIYTSTNIHPSTHSFIPERMGRWMKGWASA